MMRSLWIALGLAGCLTAVRATTLQQLPLDEMAQKSTAIVRAKVVGSAGVLRGADVYTVYELQIEENWKSGGASIRRRVAVPGGMAGGWRQTVAGAPALQTGQEYVIFLWTGRSGLTQIMGLSQGLFDVRTNAAGDRMAMRAAAGEQMLDAAGRAVRDQAVSMKLSELKARVSHALSAERAAR